MVKKRVQYRQQEESDVEVDDWTDEEEVDPQVADVDSDSEDDDDALDSDESYSHDIPTGSTVARRKHQPHNKPARSNMQLSNMDEDGDLDSGIENSNIALDLQTVSFGALASAQRSLKRKRDGSNGSVAEDVGGDDEEEEVHRSTQSQNSHRLAEIKGKLQSVSADSKSSFAEALQKARAKREQMAGVTKETKTRSSKHAPMEISSKKAVSRRRTVIEMPTDTRRDPRFDRVGSSGIVDTRRVEKNYAFLDDYQESEIKELKQQITKEKNEARKEQMEKVLQSLESKRKTKRKRQEQEQVLAEHKKQEREAIKQGKTPYYLKKSDQKKLILTSQFAKMGEKQRERAIQKKRKKIASKEKKKMPWSRRTATTEV